MKLEIDHLSKKYGEHTALQESSLQIKNCKTAAILGPSGSGKSTLLRLISGLEIPSGGSIAINDHLLVFEEPFLITHRKSLGVVFQAFNLFPHLTALENIELPLRQVHGFSPEEAKETALQFLKRFDLLEHAFKRPAQLSGGQRQRVAIVRAVAIKAKLLILDEATSALDPLSTSEVLDLIVELRNEGTDILLASHHIGFAHKVADWIIFMDEGKILESSSTNDFFNHPKTPQAKAFLAKVLKY